MAHSVIEKDVFKFLKQLKQNNSREWFAAHKKEFKAIEAEVKRFYQELLELMNTHDNIEKLKMFRIYRDVRFSHDKSPYQSHFAGSFSRAGANLRGGYYLRIKPGETFIAVGFWGPEKQDLLRIRKEFEQDATAFRSVIDNKKLKKYWGTLEGEEVKTAPKGFGKAHPNIDLIKKKQFIFVRNFTDAQVLDRGFLNEVNTSFLAIRPYFDIMSDILSTDLNGTSLLK